MNKFRETHPKRTYSGKNLSNYRGYKPYLAPDFNNRCGYTDTPDHWLGGSNNFHIDHFIPHTHKPELKEEYSNLVYACSYVNIAKSNDDSTFYLDPCDTDYNEHFYRNEIGEISYFSDSENAKYMYLKLKLYLRRYGILWLLDQIYNRMKLLSDYINAISVSSFKSELESLLAQLVRYFTHYFEQFKLSI